MCVYVCERGKKKERKREREREWRMRKRPEGGGGGRGGGGELGSEGVGWEMEIKGRFREV